MCWLLLSFEVLENLETPLYSESRENDCFLSPVTFDKGPFATVESIYCMLTEMRQNESY